MENTVTDVMKFGIALLSIVNPLGAIPIFLSITKDFSEGEIKKIASSCSLAVVITIIISLVIGQKILQFFGISIASFRVGGGFLLFTMSLSMISAKSHNSKMNKDEVEEYDPSEIGIVPLAIPLLAGPGAISTSIIKAEALNTTTAWIGIVLITIFVGLLIKIVLSFSRPIGDKLGTLGLNVMTRVMGLILMALAIEFVTLGIKQLFPVLSS